MISNVRLSISIFWGHQKFTITSAPVVLFLWSENPASVGDLYKYELTGTGDESQLGLLFAIGATIIAQFSKLVFRKKRVKRSYEVAEIYRP